MATKKYRVTPKAAPFLEQGNLSFRVRFGQPQEGGGIKIRAKENCPILTVKQRGVVQTENTIAQRMIEAFNVPTMTKRNGQSHPPGPMFEEYAGGAPVDLDLDPIFDAVP